jgi:hypothetical protein
LHTSPRSPLNDIPLHSSFFVVLTLIELYLSHSFFLLFFSRASISLVSIGITLAQTVPQAQYTYLFLDPQQPGLLCRS